MIKYELVEETGFLNDEFQLFLHKAIDDEKYRHDCYLKSVEHAEEMGVHLYGDLPEKLLNMVRPREEKATKDYRLAAYQPTTKSTAEKGVAIVSKIFNPALYTIQWKNRSDNASKLEKYTLESYPEYNSVITFLQQTATKKMLADPNGVMAVTITDYDIKEEDRPEPVVKIYGSKNIWYQDHESFLIFKRREVQQKGPDLFFFCFYDENKIVEFTAYKVTPDKVAIVETKRYEHGFGEIPVWHLRGVPEVMDNGSVYYKSFFEAAVPFWNLAINHESDLFGAYINHLHPLRAELAEECDYRQDGQRCKQGRLTFADGKAIDCPSCHGSGYRSVKSPYGVYQFNKEKLSGEGSASLVPVQYITVPTEPTAMLERRVEMLLEKGLYALNMDILNKVGENQSGVAKVIDRDELYDFLYRISTVMFDIHLSNIFYFINKYMFGVSDKTEADKNLPEINKPTQFDIQSAMEIVEELKVAKEAKLNPQYIRQKQKQANDKEWASSPDIKTKLDLMIELDPAPELNPDDIKLIVDSGFMPKEYAVIHHNIEIFVDKALAESKNFTEMPKDKKLEILKKYAQELMKDMKPVLDQSAIDDGNGTNGQARKNNSSGE